MRRVSIKKYPLLFRTATIYAVLIGLLFSCGEGIRLLPFPEAETTKNNSSQLNVEDKIPYQYNAHRFEEQQGNQKTKSQRNSQNHYRIENGVINNSIFRLWLKGDFLKFSHAAEVLKLPLFSESGESRAPPSII